MPRTATAERMCNLTLSRSEWSVLVSMLDRCRHPIASKAKAAIADQIRESDGAASISIDRTCEAWATVLNLVWNDGVKRGGETNRVCCSMTCQISAAKFTTDF